MPVIAIIVVWLFVLAPWLLGRSNRPMSHTGEAFEDTRVLFSGDSGNVAGRRRPRLRADDVHRSAADEDQDYEVVSAAAEDPDREANVDDVLIDEEAEDRASRAQSRTIAGAARRARAQPFGVGGRAFRSAADEDGADAHDEHSAPAEDAAETIEGEVIEESVTPAAAADTADTTDATTAADSARTSKASVDADADLDDADDVLLDDERAGGEEGGAKRKRRRRNVAADSTESFTAPVAADIAEDAYDYDETYTSPVDLMYPGAVDPAPVIDAEEPDTAETDSAESESDRAGEESAEVDEYGARGAEDAALNTDLSEDEVAFAQRRLGRGGWDPVADKEKSATRYQRRQRTLIGLAIAVVLTVALGIVAGGWTWWLAGIVGVLTGIYLVALRAQVRQEQALLRRRVKHLRRTRLGVHNTDDEALKIPRNLRRPGAVVVEIDDESPDFEHLPLSYSDDEDGDFDGPHAGPDGVGRRDDLAARRAG
ncbi:divisome protein SepX/GlpR [Corynebacterium rhinophilum]|uniref:divisome protein SepX/GlpR n=1 Tax=Corynebacterium rhinophilum TaxID=3050197 RepID=UPI0033079C68